MERGGVIPCHKQIYFVYRKSHFVMENINAASPSWALATPFIVAGFRYGQKRVTTNYYYYYYYYYCCCCCCCLLLLLLEYIFFAQKVHHLPKHIRCKDQIHGFPKTAYLSREQSMRIRGPLLGVYRRDGPWGLWGLGAPGAWLLKSPFLVGKSPFLIGDTDTSSNGWNFSIVILTPQKWVSMVCLQGVVF